MPRKPEPKAIAPHRQPDLYQCEPCPVCGQKSLATAYEPQAVCLTCIDKGTGPTALRVTEVYLAHTGLNRPKE